MKNNDALKQVRCFLLDMDGTFYLGEQLLEGALEFIDVLRQQGCEYLFLTNNSSKDGQQYVEKITRLGLPVSRDKILTSGEATAMHLRAEKPGARVYVVGTSALEDEFRGRGFLLTDESPDFVVLGFDTTLTYAKLWKLCDLVRAGVPYLATHPDYNCPTETGFMPDIGATIAFVNASTGREPDLVVGKPNRLLVEKAAERTGISLTAMCMIGDRLYTDIALGATAGIPTILVLSGETHADEVASSPHQPSYIFQNLGAVAEHLINMNSAHGMIARDG
jgi:HAD superfamily hydrolase (TIGR01457 family)